MVWAFSRDYQPLSKTFSLNFSKANTWGNEPPSQTGLENFLHSVKYLWKDLFKTGQGLASAASSKTCLLQEQRLDGGE